MTRKKTTAWKVCWTLLPTLSKLVSIPSLSLKRPRSSNVPLTTSFILLVIKSDFCKCPLLSFQISFHTFQRSLWNNAFNSRMINSCRTGTLSSSIQIINVSKLDVSLKWQIRLVTKSISNTIRMSFKMHDLRRLIKNNSLRRRTTAPFSKLQSKHNWFTCIPLFLYLWLFEYDCIFSIYLVHFMVNMEKLVQHVDR